MNRRATIFAGVASAVTLAVLALGIGILDAPSDERARGLDGQRLRDLQQLSAAIEAYYRADAALPADLETLRTRLPNRSLPLHDAASGQGYDYRPTGERTYELCARFDTPAAPDPRAPSVWHHGIGRHCFALGVAGPG